MTFPTRFLLIISTLLARANPHFVDVWERSDRPVEQAYLTRTWMRGSGGIAPADSDWRIIQVLLTTEPMTGNLQFSDAAFEHHASVDICVAGDPVNDESLNCAQMGSLNFRSTCSGDDLIIRALTSGGQISRKSSLDAFVVSRACSIPQPENHIASIFCDFVNSTGTIFKNHQFLAREVFSDPFAAMGCVTEGQDIHIRAAIDNADLGDEICVEAGTYAETLEVTRDSITMSGQRGVVLDNSNVKPGECFGRN